MTKFNFKTLGYFFIFVSFTFLGFALHYFYNLLRGDWITATFVVAVASMFVSVWTFRLALLLLVAKSKNFQL